MSVNVRGRLVALLCGAALLGPAWADGKSTLDQVLKNPGVWNQMCSPGEPKPWSELPFPGYHRSWTDQPLSPQNVQKLRADRARVLKSISAKLDQITPALVKNESDELADRPPGGEAAAKVDQTLELCCMALLDLNGSEDLPALLRLESALAQKAKYAAPRWKNPEYHFTYLRHVQVLATMGGLLHNEGSAGVSGMKSPSTLTRAARNRIVEAARRQVASGHYKGVAAMPANPDYR